MPHGKSQMLRDMRRVDHLYLSVLDCGGIHLSINYLKKITVINVNKRV
jgi:hypothetical protein